MDIQKESLQMPANEKRKIRKKEKKRLFDGILKESLTFGGISPISLKLEKLNKDITITRLQSS